MSILKYHILIITGIVLFGCSNSNQISQPKTASVENDDFYEKCRTLVLSENKISKTYTFKINGKEIDELEVKYLGNVITTKNDTLKIINSINYTGLFEDSRRANANVFLYNNLNKKLGYYHLGHLNSLPSEIRKNSLIFNYNDEYCNQTTIINLRDSIPKEIFINCTSKGGDLYNFER